MEGGKKKTTLNATSALSFMNNILAVKQETLVGFSWSMTQVERMAMQLHLRRLC